MDLEQTLQDLGPVIQLASDLVVVYLGKKTMLSIILLAKKNSYHRDEKLTQALKVEQTSLFLPWVNVIQGL